MILAESRFLALLHFASFCEIGRTSTCTYLYILHTYLPLSLVRGNRPARPARRRWLLIFIFLFLPVFTFHFTADCCSTLFLLGCLRGWSGRGRRPWRGNGSGARGRKRHRRPHLIVHAQVQRRRRRGQEEEEEEEEEGGGGGGGGGGCQS